MSQGDDPHALSGETEEVDALPVPDDEQLRAALEPVSAPAAAGRGVAAGGEPTPRRALASSLSGLRATPAVQVAAVAAGGFVAGAAVVGLARRRRPLPARADRRARAGRGGRRGGGARRRQDGELLRIVGSRSLLVDVHLLGSPGRAH